MIGLYKALLVLAAWLCTRDAFVDAALTVVPQNEEVLAGSKVVLRCSTDSRTPIINWIHYTRPTTVVVRKCTVVTGFTSDYSVINNETGRCDLVIKSATSQLAGKYECSEAGSDYGISSYLTIIEPKEMSDLPLYISVPISVVLFVVIVIAIIYCIYRGRRGRNGNTSPQPHNVTSTSNTINMGDVIVTQSGTTTPSDMTPEARAQSTSPARSPSVSIIGSMQVSQSGSPTVSHQDPETTSGARPHSTSSNRRQSRFKKAIEGNEANLIEEIIVIGLWAQLRQRGILTSWQLDECESQPSTHGKKEKLLEVLKLIDDDHYEAFCDALETLKQQDVLQKYFQQYRENQGDLK